MRMIPRSEQAIPQLHKLTPEPVIEVSSLDLLMLADELGFTLEFDESALKKRPS